MHLPRTAALLGLITLAACGDPFSPPVCYSGPGCGDDNVKPVGRLISPGQGATVYCPFWLEVEATDNIGVLGVNYLLQGFPIDKTVDVEPPYKFLVDPKAADGLSSVPGPRSITILVHDVADNIDTLELTVNYQY